jgi:hypothetical protein
MLLTMACRLLQRSGDLRLGHTFRGCSDMPLEGNGDGVSVKCKKLRWSEDPSS